MEHEDGRLGIVEICRNAGDIIGTNNGELYGIFYGKMLWGYSLTNIGFSINGNMLWGYSLT